ncbi:hypothetical protein JW758_05895 [Candidatus Peregrinibacteria bacterium]|nr:hypothetical protein [Candidatus Peregrinibacteria bacterium]
MRSSLQHISDVNFTVFNGPDNRNISRVVRLIRNFLDTKKVCLDSDDMKSVRLFVENKVFSSSPDGNLNENEIAGIASDAILNILLFRQRCEACTKSGECKTSNLPDLSDDDSLFFAQMRRTKC